MPLAAGEFVAPGRQGGPAGFHGRFLNGILAGPSCRREDAFVVAEGAWSRSGGGFAPTRSVANLPSQFRGVRWDSAGLFSARLCWSFGAARMFTASLAVAKPPPSRRRACRPRSRAKRPGGLLRRGGCGRFAPCPPGAGGTQTLRGADKQTLSALALSGRLCRFSGKRSRCSLSAGVGDGGIGSRAGLCAEAPPQGELLSGAKLRESHKMGV